MFNILFIFHNVSEERNYDFSLNFCSKYLMDQDGLPIRWDSESAKLALRFKEKEKEKELEKHRELGSQEDAKHHLKSHVIAVKSAEEPDATE